MSPRHRDSPTRLAVTIHLPPPALCELRKPCLRKTLNLRAASFVKCRTVEIHGMAHGRDSAKVSGPAAGTASKLKDEPRNLFAVHVLARSHRGDLFAAFSALENQDVSKLMRGERLHPCKLPNDSCRFYTPEHLFIHKHCCARSYSQAVLPRTVNTVLCLTGALLTFFSPVVRDRRMFAA